MVIERDKVLGIKREDATVVHGGSLFINNSGNISNIVQYWVSTM